MAKMPALVGSENFAEVTDMAFRSGCVNRPSQYWAIGVENVLLSIQLIEIVFQRRKAGL